MSARKKSEETQKALRQRTLEVVHQVLYCDTEWKEHEIYAKRFQRIVERTKLNLETFSPKAEAIVEYNRRVEKTLSGKVPLDKSLPFFQILMKLAGKGMLREELFQELELYSCDCLMKNVEFLLASGFLTEDVAGLQKTLKARKRLAKLK